MMDSLDFTRDGLLASSMWLRVTSLTCVVGALLALVSILLRMVSRGPSRVLSTPEGVSLPVSDAGAPRTPVPARLLPAVLVVALVTGFTSIWNRYVEVNHFPSQTMSEVLVMASWFGLVSLFVLMMALGLNKMGQGWAVLGDALYVLVFLSVWGINAYSTTLSTAQRDLPPALQSYWFPPHLTSLIFSYMTLAIAGLIALLYFCIRFWSGIFSGGRGKGSQLLVLGLLTLLPFGHLITIPVLLVVGVVFVVLKLLGRLPSREAVAGIESSMDAVSYRAFCVGIPFLTAGLFMGAFWAQEAWANYWGWDSKENSALITWLIYIVYVHLRMLGGYRGEKAMAVLMGGALSVFMTFQIFGYLPDSQKSLHRYTDDGVVPREGMQGAAVVEQQDSARLDEPR